MYKGFIKYWNKVLATLILVVLILNIMPKVSFASDGVFGIEMLVDKTEVYPGEEITFTIKYSYSSTIDSAKNVTVVDTLPAELVYLGYEDSEVIQSVIENNNVVTFTFDNILADGTTGTLKIRAKFKEGITQKDITIDNSAYIVGDNVAQENSNIVTVTTKIKDPDFTVTKERIIPGQSTTPTLNSDVKYKITVNSNSTIGGLNLTDLVITDTIEGNSILEGATSGYHQNNNIITWELSELGVGQSKNYYITVSYPDTDFNLADTVENRVTVAAKVYGDDTTVYERSDSVSHGFATSDPKINGINKTSRQANDEYYFNQIAKFYINGLENSGNVPLDEFVLVDTVPLEIDITSVTTGSFANADGGNVTLSFKTNEDPANWRFWGANSASSSETYDLLDIIPPLNPTEYITEIKWDYGTVVPGFAQSSSINVFGKVLEIDNEYNLIQITDPPHEITNIVQLTASYTEEVGDPPAPVTQVFTKNSSETIKVVDAKPWIVANKTVVGNSAAFEGEYVEFNLQIKNHEFATGDFLSPVAIERLPAELEDFQFLSWYDETGAEHYYDSSNNVTGFTPYTKDDIDYFKWTFSGITLEPGEDVHIRVKAKIKEETKAGFINNTFYIFPNGIDYKSGVSETDTDDHDNDGNITEKVVPSTTRFFVKFKGNLTSDKWQRGELDVQTEAGWNQYPDHGETVPGGISDYRLIVENRGSNGPIANIVIIDVLPRIGDKGIIDTRPRESAWRPNLVNEITGKDGAILDSRVTVYYTTEEEPDLSQLYDPTTKVTDGSDGWSTVVPEDITSVTAVKFDFGDIVLQPDDGTQVVLEWPMRAPVGTPEDYIAWNTFAYGATYPDERNGVEVQEPFLPSEPRKVGFAVRYQRPVNLGDFIWEDMNMNGQQDSGEPGINGVLVELFQQGNPDPIAYTRSGDSHPEDIHKGAPGFYLFPYIKESGTYYVKFTLPSYFPEYLVTPQNVLGVAESEDSDVDPVSWESDPVVINIETDDDNLDIDLGIYQKASIGDLVWNDRDMDGIQDSDEPGLDNIVVKLYQKVGDTYTDTKIRCVTGDKQYIFDDDSGTYIPYDSSVSLGKGEYIFTQLDPGTYQLEFLNYDESNDTLELYKISAAKQGSDPGKDSNIQHISTEIDYRKTEDITVESGEHKQDIDAGMYMAELGNMIWHDLDADGIKDGDESGIEDVIIELFQGTDSLGTTKTDSGGFYQFIDLLPGSYHIEVANPGYDAISPLHSMGSDNDNDLNSSGITSTVTLAAGERYYKLDGSFYNYASVGNLIWNDLDHDGRQDDKEFGIDLSENAIELFSSSGDSQGTTSTDANGNYIFNNLVPGSYYIVVDVPTEYVVTGRDQVSDDVDSDIDSSGRTHSFTLASDEDLTTIDGGLHKALIGDRVWEDMDADGIQDVGEPGFENFVVELFDSGDTSKGTYTTGSDGFYQFTNLDPDDYYIVVTAPVDSNTYVATKPNVPETTDNKDSDIDTTTFKTPDYTLVKGETNKSVDAGFYIPASVGDYVWEDVNGDGIQGNEIDEPPIAGVVVNLYEDLDGDGIFAFESSDTTVAGKYLFDDLIPGKYKLEVVLPNVLPDVYDGFIDIDVGNDELDSDINWTKGDPSGFTDAFSLESNQHDRSKDAGLYRKTRLGDLVWEDEEANGIYEPNDPYFEKGYEGAVVNLLRNNYGTYQQIATTTTDINGNYLFIDLAPGQYKIQIVKPDDYRVTFKQQGDNQELDSDTDPTSHLTDVIQLDSNVPQLYWDIGIYKSNSIGDFVWIDKDGNNTQDSSELGLNGVEVRLYNYGVYTGKSYVTGSDSSLADGKYLFEDLDAGSYQIGIDMSQASLEDYYLTVPNDGNGDDVDIADNALYSNIDSDIKENTKIAGINVSGNYVLNSDMHPRNADIGLYKLASLGNFIWHDLNADGIQDSNEPGLNHLTVSLRGDHTDTDTTENKNSKPGYYIFENLAPGNYYVEYIKPVDTQISPDNQGADDEIDSDFVYSGSGLTYRTPDVALSTGEENDTLDMGLYWHASVGNLVWHDQNGNGKQDSEESGIDGVTVDLLSKNGAVWEEHKTTTTSGGGTYEFTGLTPGDYAIKVDLSSATDSEGNPFDGFIDQNIGDDDDLDSDVDANGLSEGFTLISKAEDMSWDAGLYQNVSIGDYIWEDINANGVQDDSETGLQDVNVKLYRNIDGTFTQIASTTTNAAGEYLFSDQKPGEFYIEIDKPGTTSIPSTDNYRIAIKDSPETTDALDSDANLDNARTDSFSVASGDTDLTIDIGLYLKNTLGDKVWLDKNGDGLQTDEDGIEGIKVHLYDTNGWVASDTTNNQGAYFFDNLDAGTYEVRLIKSEIEALGYTATEPDVDSNSNDEIDSDLDPDTFRTTATYTFYSDDHDLTVDIGLYKLATIGDYVWDDKNGDGIQNEMAAGIEDVEVELYDLLGNLVKETNTDEHGLYQITGIPPGDYYVKFTAPSNYVVTEQNIDSDNTDSDINNAGKTATITLESGDLDESIDAGFYIPITIGDRIWEDNDADGIQNDGDSGINDVLVELYKQGGATAFKTTTTADDSSANPGYYEFTDLPPGSYYIKVTKPDDDYIFSDKGSGTATDSDVDVNSGESSLKTYISGDVDLDIDAGMYKLVSIGDRVWLDDNADGQQGNIATEPGIEDITVNLYQDNVLKASMETDENGKYEFSDLMPGNYAIEVLNESYYFTAQNNGDDKTDSDIDPDTGRTSTLFVPSSSVIDHWDSGLYLKNSIGDTVWLDENGNGLQDEDLTVTGISGVTVELYKQGVTAAINSMETGADGKYLFDNLEAGTYTVGVVLPTGHFLTGKDMGSDAKDSDLNQVTKRSDEIVLKSDDNNDDVDIGLYQLTTIGDYVWNDLDADGVQETGEPGIKDVIVTLHKDSDGTQVGNSVTTVADGKYQFAGIAPGSYYVKFTLPDDSSFVATKPNIGSGDNPDENDSDITRIAGYSYKTHTIDINTDEIDETLDAGFYIPAKLGNYVWEDMNGNGIQDDGKPVEGVEIELFKGSIFHDATTTANDGSYSFTGLEPGEYHIEVDLPDGYHGFITRDKGDDDKDSDVDDSGISNNVTLISGDDNEDLDVGIYKYTAIGNYVWEDLNADGVQDDDETFIKDSNGDEVVVQVNLFKSDESPEIEFSTTTTNGMYGFTDLIPGEYRVEFELLSNYYISAQNAAGNIEKDSNPDKDTGVTADILLESGKPDDSIDCGMYKANSIGDRVWHDTNGDGIQDDLESGIAGIEVGLYDSAGNYLGKNVTTDSSGAYLFGNLEQGSYRIGLVSTKGYTITKQNVGDDAKDSDIALGGTMLSDADKPYVLKSNTHVVTADIGLYKLGSIGDYVWEDMNGDGEQNDGATGLADIEVELEKPDGSVDEVQTDSDGKYLFTDLHPGEYELRFNRPTGYHFTTQNTGAHDNDSDVNEDGFVSYTLKSDEDNLDLDAGLVIRGDIGDYVWNDSNKNGIQDTNEQGLAKYKVKLIYSDGSSQETETDAVGYYKFTDLQPGVYQVQFYPKSDFVITKENEGTDDSKDSNPDPSTGITPKFSLLSGDDVLTVDAGMYYVPDPNLGIGEGSIGDYVWIDYDKDGIQDSSEKGVEGVKVILIPKSADRIETYTDSNGKYLFDQLPDGLYSVRVEEPTGYKTTIRNAGSNKDKDSDANKNGFIEVVRLINSADLRNIDIGLIGTAELGDFVWDDLNSNGAQDFGEPGVANVTVYLLDNNKNTIMQTKTDSDGKYLFTELVPGNYFVKIQIPYMYEMTLKNSAPEYQDSDGSADGLSDDVVLNPGQKRLDIDFGIKKQIPEGEIGNYVWADCSDDGVQDSFEAGVPNITVKLLDKDKTVIDTTITDSQGYYLFTNVYQGEYYIEVSLPGGMSTAKRYAASQNNDSNANAQGLTEKVFLGQKQKDMSIDIGLVKYIDVEGIITDDETGEPLANTEVVVKNRKGRVVDTITTDDSGNYVIKNISQCMEISLIPKKDIVDIPDQEEDTDEDTPVNGGVDVPDDQDVSEGKEPENGEVIIDEDGNWKYTPDPGFTGKDTFSIIITDKDGNQEEIFIEINVEEVPLGTIKELPETGASANPVLYLLGFILILTGVVLRKRLM